MAVDGRRLAAGLAAAGGARQPVADGRAIYGTTGLFGQPWSTGQRDGLSVLARPAGAWPVLKARGQHPRLGRIPGGVHGLLGQAAESDLAAPRHPADKARGAILLTTCCTAANVPSWAR